MPDCSKLNPQIKQFLDVLNMALQANSREISVEEGRKAYLDFSLFHAGWPLKMARVEDLDALSSDGHHKIGLRIYTPTLGKKLPVFVYFHGGGWQHGDIATHDSICRHLSVYGDCIVVSVDWRLAPENRFPIGINDCFDAYRWVLDHGDKYNMDLSRVGVGGDSAGGNMTGAVFQKIHASKTKMPIFQLLLYPSLDLSCSTWSYGTYKEGFFLTADKMKYYVDHYINSKDDIENPLGSPLKQKDLSYLPRTHLVTAGFDPFHGEGELYANHLKEAGVNVTYKCYESMIHAFLHMNQTVPEVETALQEIAGVLKKALND